MQDHLTYSLFSQVSNSLWQTDRLVFAFLLCCHLLVGEGKLEQKTLEQLVVFLRCLKGKSKESEDGIEGEKDASLIEGESKGVATPENPEQKEMKSQRLSLRPKPSHLPWLKETSWKYFIQVEEEFEEFRGIYTLMLYLTTKYFILDVSNLYIFIL